MRGHCGQGLFLARVAGGLSSSSRLTMEVAPWRSEVAMQSVPVSPPPMTTTFLPAAEVYCPSCARQHVQVQRFKQPATVCARAETLARCCSLPGPVSPYNTLHGAHTSM